MGLIYLLLGRNRCIFAMKTRLMGKSPSRKSMFCTQRSIQGRAKWSQVVTFSVHNCVRIPVLLPHRSYTDGPPISGTYIVRWRVSVNHSSQQRTGKRKYVEMCRMKVTNWTTVRVVIKADGKPIDSGEVRTIISVDFSYMSNSRKGGMSFSRVRKIGKSDC